MGSSQQLQNRLDLLVRNGRVPGIQYVAVGTDGIVAEACAGVADIASTEAVSPTTTFMVSSVTKTLTAGAILQLHDRGKLHIEDPLIDYVEDHPYGDELRLRHLLNQTSGIPNPPPLKWLHLVREHGRFDEAGALRQILAENPRLRFPPGTRYRYSNLSYWLLGKVIERVSGVSYAQYMAQSVFAPLHVSDTELGCSIPNRDDHARGHLKKWSVLGLVMPWMTDRKFFSKTVAGRRRFKHLYMNGPAYGGLIGTARGLSSFLADQLGTTSVLFSSEARELFYSPQFDAKGRPIVTTPGWHRGRLGKAEYYGKPGGGPGYQSCIRLYRGREIATAWLANETAATEGPINAISDELDSTLAQLA